MDYVKLKITLIFLISYLLTFPNISWSQSWRLKDLCFEKLDKGIQYELGNHPYNKLLIVNGNSNLLDSVFNLVKFKDSITKIVLSDFQDSILPNSILIFGNLDCIWIDGPKFTRFPTVLSNLNILKTLFLYYFNIDEEKMFDGISQLRTIEELGIFNCKNVKAIPSSISNLTLLFILTIEDTPIKDISDEIIKIPTLKYVTVNRSEISKERLREIMTGRFCRM